MSYPVTIVDNFFEDPDKIVETANSMEFFPTEDGRWPGSRTNQLHCENNILFEYIGTRINSIFHDTQPREWNMQMHFQKINPFHEDKYNKRNAGWIHSDIGTYFGGVVYLNKNPESDTGTSIYRLKNGYYLHSERDLSIKTRHYLHDRFITEQEYCESYNNINCQYIETVKIENVYNRLVLFSGKNHHGAQTFGTQERLTLNFFGMGISGKILPLLRF